MHAGHTVHVLYTLDSDDTSKENKSTSYKREIKRKGSSQLDYTIIRLGNFLKKWACQQLLLWIQKCVSSAHAQTPSCTAVYQFSGWIGRGLSI